MTPEEFVRSYAQQIGLNPDLAVSVWQQESSRSTDTGLKGADLSRDRGNAVGPWQVVPFYHPEFPVQGGFEDQTRYALDYLKKVGPRGYYGEGQAPAGHPTTSQYEQQVMSRIPGAGPLLASNDPTTDYATARGYRRPESPMPPPDEYLSDDPLHQALVDLRSNLARPPEPQPRIARSLPGVFFGEGGGTGDWLDRFANRLEEWSNNPITQFSLGVLTAPRDAGLGALAYGADAMRRGQGMQGTPEEISMRALSASASADKMLADVEERAARKRWLRSLTPAERAMVENKQFGLDQPAAVQNYQFLISQGVAPEQAQQMAFGKGGTTVNTGDVTYGTVPQGGVRVMDPATGQPRIQHLQGGPEEIKLSENIRRTESLANNVQRLSDLVQKHGTEFVGATAREMANLYGDIQTSVRLAQEMGAPQAAELVLLAKQIPDPTSLTENLNPFAAQTAQGAYKEILRRTNGALEWARQRYAREVAGASPGVPAGGPSQGAPSDPLAAERDALRRELGL
jgi:hypothetical protein